MIVIKCTVLKLFVIKSVDCGRIGLVVTWFYETA
jgi:hypothetical protein